MSKAVEGYFYFRGAKEKQEFVDMMWKIAEFCGVVVLTYVVMSNHFHIELHIPLFEPLGDEELLRRYELLHPKPTKHAAAKIETLREMLRQNGPEAEKWRQRMLKQMGDLSEYMKLLKQRFSIRYNRTHDRFGTLWAERYKSVLMADRDGGSQCTGVYIDLNPVRAGIVRDPKDYRFSGYGAAVGGDPRAQRGIMLLTGAPTWEEAQARYRTTLFAVGSGPSTKGASISQKQLDEVLRRKGRLPLAAVLRCRMTYLTNTLVLGSQDFVERHLDVYRRRTGARLPAGPRPLPPWTDWGGLCALRRANLPVSR